MPWQENPSILLIDDNPDDRMLVMRELEREFPGLRVEQAIDTPGFGRALEGGGFDLVITDYQLHWTDGLAVLRAVKARWPECPVIMFTATGTEEVAVEAMKRGLDDYIVKSPKHFMRLAGAVRGALKSAEERAMRRWAESRYEDLYMNAPVAYLTIGPDGLITDANSAAGSFFGCSAGELSGVDILELHAEESRTAARRIFGGTGAVEGDEMVYKRRDGAAVNGLLSVSPLKDELGNTVASRVVIIDITGLIRAEESLRESEKSYRELAESIADVFFAMDRDLRCTYWNRASEELTGISAADAVGRSIYELFPDERGARAAEIFWEVTRTGRARTFNLEYDIRGARRHFEISAYPARDRLSVFARDVTERRRAEERLENLNRLFLGLGADLMANMEEIMQAGLEILGGAVVTYHRTVKGKPPCTLSTVPGEAVKPIESLREHACCEVIRGCAPLCIEDLDATPYAETDPCVREYGLKSFLGFPVLVEGRAIGCLALFDTRERKFGRDEAELLGTLARALAVEEERLAREENMKDFIDIASHELRHPITLMKGYSLSLREQWERLDVEQVREMLDAIDQGAERLNRLAQGLLDLSHIERGRFRMQRRETDLAGLVRQVVADVRREGVRNEIGLELPAGPVAVNVDPERTRELLIILLENAAKFSTLEAPIEVEVVRMDGEIVVSVLDRGVGIPEEYRELVFRRFAMVEDATHHSLPGMGIGLYIAKEIVEAHSGRIWCEPREGGGSAFRFALPP